MSFEEITVLLKRWVNLTNSSRSILPPSERDKICTFDRKPTHKNKKGVAMQREFTLLFFFAKVFACENTPCKETRPHTPNIIASWQKN